jgi:phosphoglycolate phosphatase-like HAD superfamily hydrolase
MHVVWDWNGTLFDDLQIVVEAVNVGIAEFGRGPIDLDDYRDHYTRPVRMFYEGIFGQPLAADEWHRLDAVFHDAYRELLGRATLTADAEHALASVSGAGHSQSLLSMFPHAELLPLVEKMGIAAFFDRVDGLQGPPGDRKAAYLESHLRDLTRGEAPAAVLVIGDTPDDALAAAHVGARCVLYDSGAHHRADLDVLGVPLAGSLVEAVSLGLGQRRT